MKRNILDILTFIMSEIQSNPLQDIDFDLMVETLEEHGYSDEEISAAMDWISQHSESIDRLVSTGNSDLPRPVWRQLNDVEKDAISPNAFSYLFHLRELELLRDDEMEAIIDRAIHLDLPSLNVEDMQDLIAIVVLDYENNASKGYFQFSINQLPH